MLDTETTGFIPRVNHIIEFASVRCEDGKRVDEYEQLFALEGTIPPVVRALTRIEDSALEGKPKFEDLREEILEHIGPNTLIVGQNVGFDIGMLKGSGIDLSDRPWIDTSMLASVVFPELESYSLGYMSTALSLNHEPVHRALGDVNATLELLEQCWKRLQEFPDELRDVTLAIMSKSSPGYQMLFDALPVSTSTSAPKWLTMPHAKAITATKKIDTTDILTKPAKGETVLVEESLNPSTLQTIINDAAKDTATTHWIAVKNLEATVRRMELPGHVRVLYPPFLLLDEQKAKALASQKEFTADESTLALKLALYEPKTRGDFPIHGDEKAVWSAKICCNETSTTYTDQFKDLPSVILLDHRQLLAFLADPDHAAQGALQEDAHIVIDDASMLEDTGTKAYGWSCEVDPLNAAAKGNEELDKFVGVLQLWIEKLRAFQDTHTLTKADLEQAETKGLREQLDALLSKMKQEDMPRQLSHLQKILDPENLHDRIAWIEQWQNGSQSVRSVPERIGSFLATHLYSSFGTTLLIPPQSGNHLQEILPPGVHPELVPQESVAELSLAIETEQKLDDLLENPPEGKSVILAGSKRVIENVFVNKLEELEKRGITCICQGMSGGMGRMQAEFDGAKGTVLWLLTPWSFEGAELVPASIDHLIVDALPFDHPNDMIFSKRSAHYQNGFMEYSLPRVQNRLFRLLRTFARFASKKADVLVIDKRLTTKDYGKTIAEYLMQFASEGGEDNESEVGKVSKDRKPNKHTESTGNDDQLQLF